MASLLLCCFAYAERNTTPPPIRRLRQKNKASLQIFCKTFTAPWYLQKQRSGIMAANTEGRGIPHAAVLE